MVTFEIQVRLEQVVSTPRKATSNPGLIPVRLHQRKGRGAAGCTLAMHLCGGPTLASHAPSSSGCLYPAKPKMFLSDGQQMSQLHAGTSP